jgi:hypothetical protein
MKRNKKEDVEFDILKDKKKDIAKDKKKEWAKKKKEIKKRKLNDKLDKTFRSGLWSIIGVANKMKSFTPEQIRMVEELVSIVEKNGK